MHLNAFAVESFVIPESLYGIDVTFKLFYRLYVLFIYDAKEEGYSYERLHTGAIMKTKNNTFHGNGLLTKGTLIVDFHGKNSF